MPREPMSLVPYQARDGREIVLYVALPIDVMRRCAPITRPMASFTRDLQ